MILTMVTIFSVLLGGTVRSLITAPDAVDLSMVCTFVGSDLGAPCRWMLFSSPCGAKNAHCSHVLRICGSVNCPSLQHASRPPPSLKGT